MILTSSVRGIVSVDGVDGRPLRVDAELVGRLRELVGDDEAASVAAFRAAYLLSRGRVRGGRGLRTAGDLESPAA